MHQHVRTTTQVFEDHLRLRVEGDVETDLLRNFAEDVVLLTENSNAEGHDAIRISAGCLADQLSDARFEFIARQVNGLYALLIWRDLGQIPGGAWRRQLHDRRRQDPDADHPLRSHFQHRLSTLASFI